MRGIRTRSPSHRSATIARSYITPPPSSRRKRKDGKLLAGEAFLSLFAIIASSLRHHLVVHVEVPPFIGVSYQGVSDGSRRDLETHLDLFCPYHGYFVLIFVLQPSFATQ